MADPKAQLASFSLAVGMDNVSFDESVQPAGDRPRLKVSRNTRLSKTPGVVSKAPGSTSLITGLTGARGGLIPHGVLDSTASHSIDSTLCKRVAGSGVGAIKSLAYTGQQSAFFPAQVSSAGVVPGVSQAYFTPSVAYDSTNGWTYFVSIRPVGSIASVCLVVLGDDGREIIQATDLVSLGQVYSDNRNWAAVTVHGTTALLWWAAGGLTNINVCTLTVSASALTATIGVPVVIYTQTATSVLGPQVTQLAYDDSDTAYVYLVCPHDSVANQLRALRISTASLTVANSSNIALAGAYSYVSCAYLANTALIVAASVNGVGVTELELSPSLAAVWTQTAKLYVGQVGCGFQTYSGATYRVFAASRVQATFDSTYAEFRDSTGALLSGGSGNIPHQTMIGHVVTQRDAAGKLYALVPTQACYRPENAIDSYSPADVDFLSDPSIELARFEVTWNSFTSAYMLVPSVVARVGTDLCIRYPGSLVQYDYTGAAANVMFVASPRSCISSGTKVLVSYLAENTEDGTTAIGYLMRYVWLSFASTQPRYTLSYDGTAIVAGALPAVWDGSELVEFSPLRVPVITGTTGGGSGPALTGAPATYMFAVVVSWKDSQGRIHRSCPSNTVTLTGAGMKPTITIKLPLTYRNLASQFGTHVTVYASEPDGTVMYAQPYYVQYLTTIAPGQITLTVSNVAQPVVDAFHPAIYTDGSATQELPAFCPNACLDVATVSERLWMLDAERPGRWWHSKSLVGGFFYEMSPDLYVDLPANGGTGVAVSEYLGSPVFFSTRGVWTVAGEGPDALNQPPFFSSPQQLSDVACTQRNSVLRTPVGVMFVSNSRFALFAGQVREFPDVDAQAYGSIVGGAVFRSQQEAAFFTAQGYAYVYNWLRDAWTLWDTTVTGLSTIVGVAQLANGRVLLCDEASIRLLDPSTASTSSQITLETGWIVLGGPQDNNVVQSILLHSKRAAAHGVDVTVSVDYAESPSITKSYSATEVLNSVTDQATSLRYDIYPELVTMPARAVKVTLTETGSTGEAFQPVNLTIEVMKNPGKLSQAIRDAARK